MIMTLKQRRSAVTVRRADACKLPTIRNRSEFPRLEKDWTQRKSGIYSSYGYPVIVSSDYPVECNPFCRITTVGLQYSEQGFHTTICRTPAS